MKFQNREIGDLTTPQLKAILADLNNRHDEREKVRPLFGKDRRVKGAKVKKMEFPPPNPNFLKLKEAIENELRIRE